MTGKEALERSKAEINKAKRKRLKREMDAVVLDILKEVRRIQKSRMQLKPVGDKVRLCDLEPGTLFEFGGDCIALKSEYCAANGLIEAHIVGSGEQFWGGAKTVQEQWELMVQPLELEVK